ncbi:MAG: LacI family DNA-binding transcriptional regulator [Lentisphaeria bacterium]|nr:LacI family DNA-binding transcriptional regulator [Lentisphaeria bacterium]
MSVKRAGGVNMTDVALRAGVSQSTVSRVINNHPGISRRTRHTVLEALRLLGYKSEIMNLINPDEEEQLTVTLAMCPLPEQRDPFALEYFSTLATGVREGVAGQNVKFQLQTLRAGADELPDMEPGRDGAILVGYPSEELRRSLRESRIDYIITSGDIYSGTEDMVTVNNFEAGVLGCRWLLGRGVERIGFLLSPHNLSRYAGFQTELLQNGMQVRPSDFRMLADTQLTGFIEAIHHWIAEGDLPEALVVSFIDAARTVQTILQLHSIRVPEDVCLVAFDHHPGQRSDIVSLHSDPYELGYRSARRLLEKVRGAEEKPIQVVVPMTLTAPEMRKQAIAEDDRH